MDTSLKYDKLKMMHFIKEYFKVVVEENHNR